MGGKKGGGGGGDGWWVLLGLAALGLVAYYGRSGRGPENNSALIPDRLEDSIDSLVDALNRRFTKRWVDAGFDALDAYVRRAHPQLAVLVSAVYTVEVMSKRQWVPMPGPVKRQAAVEQVAEQGLLAR